MSEQKSRNPIGFALLAVAALGGGWFFLKNYEISGLDSIQLHPKSGSLDASSTESLTWSAFVDGDLPRPTASDARRAVLGVNERIPSTLASTRSPAEAAADEVVVDDGTLPSNDPLFKPIRLGSWALAGFDRNKLAKPPVMDMFSRIVRQFDVIALQQITSPERDLLPRAIAHINATGRKFDFLLGPMVGPVGAVTDSGFLGEQYAFIFDTERIEIDRGQTYTVADPGNQVAYDPLVGWFRVRGVPAQRAWTFTIVNFRVDSSQPFREVGLLANLMDSVAKDGRSEDDLILAGMLHADDRQLLARLGEANSQASVRAMPTDIFSRYQLSNIISPKKTTTEYLGRGGVVDFPRAFNLNEAQAEELTPHLPIFAEYTPTEGN